jgi:hypothetical protein
MSYVLIKVSSGIVEEVMFFDDPKMAVRELANHVKAMDVEGDDAAVYGPDGLVANAKHFLDEHDEYVENDSLIADISSEKSQTIYIIGNPEHRLGFMVASPDDPLGYEDPVEAVSLLGRMRQDACMHLKLYRVEPVNGLVARRAPLEAYNADSGIEDFDYAVVEEYLLDPD